MEKIRLDLVTNFSLSGTPFKHPRKVRRLVCCDFDDTYLPFADEEKPRSGIIGLEDFIDQHMDDLSLAIGWISGSSIAAIIRKSEKYVRRLPHFIASSLGTEFYWVSDGGIFPSYEWAERIAKSGFHLDNLRKAVREIKMHDIRLEQQHPDYQGQMMECYYYIASGDHAAEVDLMNRICSHYKVKLVLSGCSAAAGDPEGYYDAQFMPIPCGKAEAAAFAAHVFGVAPENTWAFGDSLNDMEMLAYAANSFLVANADPKAAEQFGNVVSGRFCHGIREKLAELI